MPPPAPGPMSTSLSSRTSLSRRKSRQRLPTKPVAIVDSVTFISNCFGLGVPGRSGFVRYASVCCRVNVGQSTRRKLQCVIWSNSCCLWDLANHPLHPLREDKRFSTVCSTAQRNNALIASEKRRIRIFALVYITRTSAFPDSGHSNR